MKRCIKVGGLPQVRGLALAASPAAPDCSKPLALSLPLGKPRRKTPVMLNSGWGIVDFVQGGRRM